MVTKTISKSYILKISKILNSSAAFCPNKLKHICGNNTTSSWPFSLLHTAFPFAKVIFWIFLFVIVSAPDLCKKYFASWDAPSKKLKNSGKKIKALVYETLQQNVASRIFSTLKFIRKFQPDLSGYIMVIFFWIRAWIMDLRNIEGMNNCVS